MHTPARVIERDMSLSAITRVNRTTEKEEDGAMHSHPSNDRRLIEL